jgi:hypothetical protein
VQNTVPYAIDHYGYKTVKVEMNMGRFHPFPALRQPQQDDKETAARKKFTQEAWTIPFVYRSISTLVYLWICFALHEYSINDLVAFSLPW